MAANSSLHLQHGQGRENRALGAPRLPKPNLPHGFKGDKDSWPGTLAQSACGCQQNKEDLGATVRVSWLL